MTTEILDAQTTQVAAYQPFYGELAKLEQDNAALVFQYETPKGNKEARSHVFSLRKTKGALEKVRKEAKAESLRIGRAIDSEAAEIEARIEAMITVHQLEIDRVEQIEKDRIAALDARMNEIELLKLHGGTSIEYRAEIERVQAIEIGADWQEYMARATTAKAAMLEQLAKHFADAEQREAEAAELAILRADAEARAQAERDAAIAKAAAERARAEAEAKAAAEAEKARKALEAAESEAKRKEQEAALAMQQERDRAQQEKEAAARREMQLKLQAEEAERRRVSEAQEAERRVQEAAEHERAKIAAEAKAAADAQEARERNRAHKAKINREAVASLVAGGIAEDVAKSVVTMIAQGNVANVDISY
jgi:colicin import membrane protein